MVSALVSGTLSDGVMDLACLNVSWNVSSLKVISCFVDSSFAMYG